MNEQPHRFEQKSEDIKELTIALVKVQAALEGAKKDSVNPFFKSKYADLESVWAAARPLLAPNGFAITQTMGTTADNNTTLITTLLHVSGQYISGEMPLLLKAPDPQGQGSAITYARRYALAAILGIHQTDDDAESSMPVKGRKGEITREPIIEEQTEPKLQDSKPVDPQDKPLTTQEFAVFMNMYQDKGFSRAALIEIICATCKPEGITLANIHKKFTHRLLTRCVEILNKTSVSTSEEKQKEIE